MLKDRVQGAGCRIQGCRGILQYARAERSLTSHFGKVVDPIREGLRGILQLKYVFFILWLAAFFLLSGTGHASVGNTTSSSNDAVFNQIMKDIQSATDQNIMASVDPVTDGPDIRSEDSGNIDNVNKDKGDLSKASELLDSESDVSSSAVSASTISVGGGGDLDTNAEISDLSLKPVKISPVGNSGAASTGIPINVPSGRKGIQPNIALNYSSNGKNGWLGMGWSLGLGAIQRDTKRGVKYTDNNFVVTGNGSTSELVSRDADWGPDYYGAKIEAAFSKYHYISADDRWEMTAKNGTKYFYGKDPSTNEVARLKDNTLGTFKWCLVRIQDTNGNYMTITYGTDASDPASDIYVELIKYTGNAVTGLSATNYVKFHWEDRTDDPPMYTPHFKVTKTKRLKTIEVGKNINELIRAYRLEYDADLDTPAPDFEYSSSTGRSLLGKLIMFGSNSTVDVDGNVSGDALPEIEFRWQQNGSLSFTPSIDPDPITNTDIDNGTGIYSGDWNGDGITDMMWYDKVDGNNRWYINDGVVNGELTFTSYDIPIQQTGDIDNGTGIYFGDWNGDGITDMMWYDKVDGNNRWYVNDGELGFTSYDTPIQQTGDIDNGSGIYLGDWNGDGITDMMWYDKVDGNNRWYINDGELGFTSYDTPIQQTGDIDNGTGIYFGDWNGDGVTDVMWYDKTDGNNRWYTNNHNPPDLLTTIDNGIGGETSLEYEPSSTYTNRLLPFVVQTLSRVTVNDGNTAMNAGLGIDTITEYDYSNGYYDFVEREFRGFETVKAISRNSAHDGTYTETLFKGCDPADPDNDIYKGLPIEQVTKDSSGNIYTKSISTYDYTEPVTGVYFPRLRQKDDYICDGFCNDTNMDTEALKSKTEFDYDIYGNITEKRFYAEEASVMVLDKVEQTDYAPYDTTNWLVSLPKAAYIKDGSNNIKAQTDYTYYAGTGNLQTETKWLNTPDPSPVTTYTYDVYGNVDTVTDPRNTVTKFEYDATYTFPEKVTNDFGGLGFFTQTTYDAVFIDKVSTEIDYNGNQTQYDYDEFGRIKTVTKPDPYGITEYTYDDVNRIKTVELKDRVGTVLQWQETYFDGLGRTITEKSYGTDVTTIIVDTEYNDRGQVYKKSNPYFDGAAAVYDTTYTYDALNRLTDTLNPDLSSTLISYDRGWTTYIDANSHQKVVQKDIYGQIVNVEEYTGDGSGQDLYALYATTEYEYDVRGNLTLVRDAASTANETIINYDSLSRKINMDDPDMGYWEYEYDANGNLMKQTDALGQIINFDAYDALNRVTKKNYQDGSYVQYTYDEAFSTNSTGKLTTVKEVDDQAVTTLEIRTHYDELGSITQTDRVLDGTTYTILTDYDVLERIDTITYPAPDNIVVDYAYDGHGNVETISSGGTDYITYNQYNAFAQPLQVTFGNDVYTDYTYDPENNRLQSIITTGTSGVIMNLSYSRYDDAGNIEEIIDNLDSSKTRIFKYDELDRLIEADSQSYGGKLIYQYDEIGNMTYNCRFGHYTYDPTHPHAVKEIRRTDGTLAAWYVYDDNGNMTSSESYDTDGILDPGKSRVFTYNYDNMPTSITTGGAAAVSQYDSYGTRIKKTIPGPSTTTYIGSIYECTDGACTKNILSGTQLIASITATETFYYHTDHLGSSSLITDADGTGDEVVQEIFYYPYGEIKYNISPPTENVDMKYKYTGKEWDGESGLYYYGARYYDPKLTRFISADTIVPLPFHPISLNRYAYAYNNPIILKDLDGHDPDYYWDDYYYDDYNYWDDYYDDYDYYDYYDYYSYQDNYSWDNYSNSSSWNDYGLDTSGFTINGEYLSRPESDVSDWSFMGIDATPRVNPGGKIGLGLAGLKFSVTGKVYGSVLCSRTYANEYGIENTDTWTTSASISLTVPVTIGAGVTHPAVQGWYNIPKTAHDVYTVYDDYSRFQKALIKAGNSRNIPCSVCNITQPNK